MISRISWLAATVALPAFLGASRDAKDVGESPHGLRGLAFEAANWIRAAAIDAPDGLFWPFDPANPEGVSVDFYAGRPGTPVGAGRLARLAESEWGHFARTRFHVSIHAAGTTALSRPHFERRT